MSITVSNITKVYGTQKALDNVSFEIRPGEIVGLLGPNGAGKSTIMKILTCFIPPTSGDASVCGYDILEQSIEVRRKIGYLPENNPLYLDLYVKEYLEFIWGLQNKYEVRSTKYEKHGPAITHKSQITNRKSGIQHPASRISEIIDLTGLEAEQHKKIGALSKGYRQRVGIAQALLHDPEVLILDEPTSGLDPNQLLEIRNLILKIGAEKTVMLSTHIMQEVEAICERSIIIHKGKIVADDSTKNLQEVSASKTIIKVEFSAPIDGTLLKQIPGVADVSAVGSQPLPPTPSPAGAGEHISRASAVWHITSTSSADIRGDIFRFAVENNLTVLSMNKEELKLEEVFQELTRS